jgi:hypothetical protein
MRFRSHPFVAAPSFLWMQQKRLAAVTSKQQEEVGFGK